MTGARPFTVGDHVQVASLGKGVVREVRNGNRYLVEVKSRSLLVDGAQLTPGDGRKRATTKGADQQVSQVAETMTRSHAPASIDLHGMTTDEAVAAFDTFLNDAILAGLAELRVIHGRSGGRLKSAVHGRLKVVTCVRAFRLDPSNPGVTLVTL